MKILTREEADLKVKKLAKKGILATVKFKGGQYFVVEDIDNDNKEPMFI